MAFKLTVEHETAQCETLNLEPSWHQEFDGNNYIRVAVTPEDGSGDYGVCSLQIIKFSERYPEGLMYAGVFLLSDEIDLLINGLLEAKRRMQALNLGEKA